MEAKERREHAREHASDIAEAGGRVLSVRGLVSALTQPLLLVAIWIGVAGHLALVIEQAVGRQTRWDFSHYYVSALAMREGLDPYRIDLRPLAARLGLEGIGRATYPPFFILGFEPLTLMAPHAAWWTWFAINLIALAASLFILIGLAGGSSIRERLANAALLLLFPPLGVHIFYSQTQILILLLLVGTLYELGRDRDAIAGTLIGLAALIKVFPIVMIGYLIGRRRWRAVAATVVTLTAGVAAVMIALGTHRAAGFAAGAHDVMSREFIARPANIALGSFVSRLFWYIAGIDAGGAVDAARRIAVIGSEVGLLGLTVAATISEYPLGEEWRAYSLWIVTTIMLAPTAWIHYMVLLFVPFALTAMAGWRGRVSAHALWLMFGSYGLVTVAMAIAPVLTMGSAIRQVIEEAPSLALMLAYASAYSIAIEGSGWVQIQPAHEG
jgi:hypothetical protein